MPGMSSTSAVGLEEDTDQEEQHPWSSRYLAWLDEVSCLCSPAVQVVNSMFICWWNNCGKKPSYSQIPSYSLICGQEEPWPAETQVCVLVSCVHGWLSQHVMLMASTGIPENVWWCVFKTHIWAKNKEKGNGLMQAETKKLLLVFHFLWSLWKK